MCLYIHPPNGKAEMGHARTIFYDAGLCQKFDFKACHGGVKCVMLINLAYWSNHAMSHHAMSHSFP